MVDIPAEVTDRRRRQREEYGEWVATKRIYHRGALAYTPGRPVPTSNVKRYGYDKQGLVERVSKAAPTTTTTTTKKGESGDAS